jgi:amino acid permease
MSFSRIAVAISLVFSYPLAFQGARDGVMDLFNIKERTNKTSNGITIGLLAMVTGMALKLKDVSFVLAMAGATMGNALIYVYPALMLRGAVKKMDNPSAGLKREVKFAMTQAGVGIGFGLIGAKMAIKALS